MLVEGIPLAFNPAQPEAGWVPCASFKGTMALRLGSNAQACVEWGDHLVVSSGREDGFTASRAPLLPRVLSPAARPRPSLRPPAPPPRAGRAPPVAPHCARR
jgi:hypothetical protein